MSLHSRRITAAGPHGPALPPPLMDDHRGSWELNHRGKEATWRRCGSASASSPPPPPRRRGTLVSIDDDGHGYGKMMEHGTPPISRSSSLAPPLPLQNGGSPSRSAVLRAAAVAPVLNYKPGCSHIAALDPHQLKRTLRRYALGLRWGKRVRRGLVLKDEFDEYDQGNDHQGYFDGKRRKLLPHPTCSNCSVSLQHPYLCLDCAFSGCFFNDVQSQPIKQSCIAQHLSKTGHAIAFDIHSGHAYCHPCHRSVTDPRFELIFHQERGRTSNRSSGAILGDEKALQSLCQLPKNRTSTRNPRGIHNLGATCFLSVILQSFLHNPVLRNFFLADRHNADLCPSTGIEPCMACEMDKMFRDFFSYDCDKAPATTPADPWVPSAFLYSTWRAQESSELSQSGQQDSHELFISALNALHSCLTHPDRLPSSRKPEIPRWQNENEAKGIQEDQIKEMEWGYGAAEEGREEDGQPPDFVQKLCDCVIHRAFAGVLQSDVQCLICGYRSSTHDPVLDLSVDLRPPGQAAEHRQHSQQQSNRELSALLDDDPVDGSGKHKNKKNKKEKDASPLVPSWRPDGSSSKKDKKNYNPSTSTNGVKLAVPSSSSSSSSSSSADSQNLVDCLRRYCTSERLPPSSYTCPQCGPVEASKQLSLRRLPPTLCIQLKRFEHTATSSFKIETKVRFPMKLDVREFVTPSVLESHDNRQEQPAIDAFVYDLFCVIVHEGTLNTGHYWCFCKWQDQWYRLNDTEARPASLEEVLENAYQLVYSRRALENVVCA